MPYALASRSPTPRDPAMAALGHLHPGDGGGRIAEAHALAVVLVARSGGAGAQVLQARPRGRPRPDHLPIRRDAGRLADRIDVLAARAPPPPEGKEEDGQPPQND